MPVAAYYEEVATGDLSRKDAAALKAKLASLYDQSRSLEPRSKAATFAQLIKPERPTSERAPGKGRPPNDAGETRKGGDMSDQRILIAGAGIGGRRQHSRSRDIDFQVTVLDGPPTIRKLAPAFSSSRTRSRLRSPEARRCRPLHRGLHRSIAADGSRSTAEEITHIDLTTYFRTRFGIPTRSFTAASLHRILVSACQDTRRSRCAPTAT